VILGGKSCRHQTSVNGDVVSNGFCNRTAATWNSTLSEWTMFVQSNFRNVWTGVRKQRGIRKPLLFLIRAKRVVEVDALCNTYIKSLIKVNLTATFRTTRHWSVRKTRQIGAFVTFRVSRRRCEMYIGHARLCVCPSPHSHTTARTGM